MKKNKFMKTGVSLALIAMLGFAPLADAAESYTVKKGDTLYSIAQKYDTTVSVLKKINNLKKDIIYTGNILEIGKMITVQKGDTLSRIASKYDMTVKGLKSLNKLKSDQVKVGQKLLVSLSENEDASKVSVSLKAKNGYTFDKEEPGKYILQYKKDGTYFVRIEVLSSKAKLSDVKNQAKQYLRSTGKVTEFKPGGHPFYKDASFFLYAYNSKIAQNVVVKKVDGHYVTFTIHYANKEESEGITPVMIEMLETIKLK